jgi:GNAT superfamily N-acetyltransferase
MAPAMTPGHPGGAGRGMDGAVSGDGRDMATIEHPRTDAAASVVRARPGAEAYSAQLHRTALPDGFFVALGPRFLATYHETFRASPHGVALTAWLDARPVGFLVGTSANRAHYRWVARHRGLRLAVSGLLALLVRPRLAAHFARTRARPYARKLARFATRRAGQTPGTAPTPARGQTAVLTHVAVEGAARGHGLGRALVETFVTEAQVDGAERAELVTDADNHDNHAFYRRCGWAPVEDRRNRDGARKTRFALTLH